MKPSQTPSNDNGFSLIEVTLALAIFAMAVVVLSQAYINGLMSVEAVKNQNPHEADLAWIRKKVLTLETREEVLRGGDIPTLNSGLAGWKATLGQTEVLDLHQLNLTINFPESDHTTYTEQIYLLRPTWSDPLEKSALLTQSREKIKALDRHPIETIK